MLNKVNVLSGTVLWLMGYQVRMWIIKPGAHIAIIMFTKLTSFGAKYLCCASAESDEWRQINNDVCFKLESCYFSRGCNNPVTALPGWKRWPEEVTQSRPATINPPATGGRWQSSQATVYSQRLYSSAIVTFGLPGARPCVQISTRHRTGLIIGDASSRCRNRCTKEFHWS